MDAVLRITKGKGVDIVLNSLDEDDTAASLECMAPFDRLIEVRPDLQANERRLSFPGLSNLSYHTMDPFLVIEEQPELAQRLLEDVMELFRAKKLKIIIALKLYSATETADAFRNFFDQGKTVVSIADDDVVKVKLVSTSDQKEKKANPGT
jgi:phthiocerol/phenolphthiocerol synthesis type-I polyketide synthase C